MKDKSWFAVVYMFLITAFFSSIVIGFARFTAEKVEANRQLAFEKAVLQVSGLAKDKADSQLHEIFLSRIQVSEKRDSVLRVKDNEGKSVGYVILLEGKGFWAPIKGVLGLAKDKQTITGIAFYEQNETPGLGGKIMDNEFREQFVGINLADKGQSLEIKPIGTELGKNQVHAITGATQTCARLEKMINESITKWKSDLEENK
jgi:Na+-transporting NADH:ubiquinone oxidoreductase subunit C